MQQKPIHISAGEFNEKIKNNLRDYYVYQFKRFRKDESSDYRKKGTNDIRPASTFTEEKQRLLSMLESQTQVEWTVEKGGVCCCTADTRLLTRNPFWEPYRFCTAAPRYLGWFLSMVMLLHPQVQLRDPLGQPEPVFPRLLEPLRPDTPNPMKPHSKEWMDDWLEDRIATRYSDAQWGKFCLERYFSLHRQGINCRKMRLEPDPDRFGIPRELLHQFYTHRWLMQDVGDDQFKNRLNETCAGIFQSRRISQRKEQWRLGSDSLAGLGDDPQLGQMLGFFSQTLPLGFLGARLMTRLGAGDSCIRYKHSYITKTLNDYNIADLLDAMAQGHWIYLDYRNGLNLRCQHMACFPLQIRESTQDGRQYLMYYHPGYRSLGALQLDFIDKITYGTIDLQPYHPEEIARAREMLSFVWGSSIPDFFTGNLMAEPRYHSVKLVIARDLPIIGARLAREARHGAITQETPQSLTYEVTVTDPGEMIPWIRSFSPRIRELWVDGVRLPCASPDPTACLRAHLTAAQPSQAPLRHQIAKEVTFHPLKNPQYPHRHLFNPIFSLAFDTILEVAGSLLEQPDRFRTQQELLAMICQAWPLGIQLQDELLDAIYENITILCSGSSRRGYRLDYLPDRSCRSLWDLIPLSQLETAYLKGILGHPKARLFLSDTKIREILSNLDPQIPALDFSQVFYYDQHKTLTPYYESENARAIFTALLGSALTTRALDTVYAGQRKTLPAKLTVAHLEYSKREDKFWACCADGRGWISWRNLERFLSAQITGDPADPQPLRQLAQRQQAENTRRLVLQFTDEKNRAQRLVTEFSPWKKICSCVLDTDPRRYTMELFYDTLDSFEIAVRLLSYGPGITILSDTGEVAHQLQLRQNS